MTRKHFEAIAAELATLEPAHRIPAAMAVADALRSLNPRFNWDKFVRACGVSVTIAVDN